MNTNEAEKLMMILTSLAGLSDDAADRVVRIVYTETLPAELEHMAKDWRRASDYGHLFGANQLDETARILRTMSWEPVRGH